MQLLRSWAECPPPAVTKEYKFTVAAQRIGYDADRIQLLKYAYEGTAPDLLH